MLCKFKIITWCLNRTEDIPLILGYLGSQSSREQTQALHYHGSETNPASSKFSIMAHFYADLPGRIFKPHTIHHTPINLELWPASLQGKIIVFFISQPPYYNRRGGSRAATVSLYWKLLKWRDREGLGSVRILQCTSSGPKPSCCHLNDFTHIQCTPFPIEEKTQAYTIQTPFRTGTPTAKYWSICMCQSQWAYCHLMKKHILLLKLPKQRLVCAGSVLSQLPQQCVHVVFDSFGLHSDDQDPIGWAPDL